MTILLKQIFGLLKLLNSDTGVNQIAMGVVCGLILAFAPTFSIQTIFVIFIIFFFRIQIGAAFIAMFFFAIPALLLDPLFHIIGSYFLEIVALKGVYTFLYNAPIIPFTKFNNSIVMGALISSFFLSPFVFLGTKKLIIKYRVVVLEKIKQTKFFKALKATSLFKWYAKYDQLYK